MMTPRQRDVYRFIKAFIKEHGYAPHIKDIGNELGVSASTAHHHVNWLVTYGYIVRERYKTAGIRLPDSEEAGT